MEIKDLSSIIARESGVRADRVENVLKLVAEGATVPFIARYRKEMTGSMDEIAVKAVIDRAEALRNLEKRKVAVLESIEQQGKLTDKLKEAIDNCSDLTSLEDLYLPFRPKRRTRASVAREKGLEPLAAILMSQRLSNPADSARRFVKGDVGDIDEALAGASDIIAEWISENASNRSRMRQSLMRRGRLEAKAVESGTKYDNYADYSKPLQHVAPHHFLAIKRGESEKILKVNVSTDEEGDIEALCRSVIHRSTAGEVQSILKKAIADGYKRLLLPSITNEVMAELKERSDKASIALFSEGLRQVLLAPPLGQKPVMAIDPGFRTGCKVVCLSAEGDLLAHDVIYPVPPHTRTDEASRKIRSLLSKYPANVIALGDGTASRETEAFLRGLGLKDVKIEKVSEQGASIYSASETARAEFPDLDLTFRSAVSIGRRLQDTLAELVKIDPKSIGVGQYQHDVNQSLLKSELDFVVSRCVNEVGVNVNTASVQLLGYVSGIGPMLAGNIVAYRTANGPFASRNELKKVARMGAKAFEQCSGFLRIPDARNPLDASAVHPESYPVVEKMAASVGCKVAELIGNAKLIDSIDIDRLSRESNGAFGKETLTDIVGELKKPGRDPREAVESEWQNDRITKFEDLAPGMVLNGKVVNLTAFGAFIDLGIKENGLIHISQMSDRRISSASEVLKMWQIVTVKVLDVDMVRRRISLTMLNV